MLKELLLQKKFLMTILGLLAAFTARYGFELPLEEAAAVLGAFLTYVYSQGKADQGKEAAKIQAASPKPPDTLVQQINEAEPSK